VFHDLQPYICTFDRCSDALTTFPTRKLWAEHEFREHRVSRFLRCYCLQPFTNKEIFLRHLRYEHLLVLHGTQLRTQLAAAEMAVEQPLCEQLCPLCLQGGPFGKDRWTSQRQFIAHVGRHLEEIALASLPRDMESDTEASSQRSGSSTPLHTSMRNHVLSVSVRSQSSSQTTRRNWQDVSTAVPNTRSPPQGLDAQSKPPNDETLHQSWWSFHKIAASASDIDTRGQSNLQASNRHSASDHTGSADRLVRQEDLSALDSLQECLTSSPPQRPSEVYSAINSSSEVTWLQQNDSVLRLQPQVQQEPSQIAPQFTLPYVHTQQPATREFYSYHVKNSQYGIPEKYYEQSEITSYLTTPPRTIYEQTDFHNSRLFRECGYNSPHQSQDYTENLVNSSDLRYTLPEAHYQLLPSFENEMNLTVQPVQNQGPSQIHVDGGIEQHRDLNLERDSVPWTSDRSTLVPNSRKQGKRRKDGLRQPKDLDQGSASLEFDKDRPPGYTTTMSEPGRAVKRRRLAHEQGDPNILDNDMLWQETASETQAAWSQLAAVTSNDNGSAFEVPEAFEKPHPSNSVIAGAPQSVSRLPSALLARARRGKTLRPRAEQVSTQANSTDLNPHHQTISNMYLTQGKTLVKIMEFLRNAHGVVAR
jgi:hypothetical protein